MRSILLLSAAALALTACGNPEPAANADMNAMSTDNMMIDPAMNADANAMAGGMDANMATNSATENAMATDMNTNDPDTNLANGM